MYSIAEPEKKLKQKTKRRAKADDRILCLRRWLCPLVYGYKGIKTPNNPSGIWPSIKIEQLQRKLAENGHPNKLANYMLMDHFRSETTHYYYSDPDAEELLLMIDVDVQKSQGKGTPAGALAYIKHVNEKLFKGNLYFEPSTGGKGQHGYIRIKNTGNVHAAIRKLTEALRAEMGTHDVELVEVKGTPIKSHWIKGRQHVVGYGQFAKIPRLKTTQDADRLAATTLLTVDEIMSWSAPRVQQRTSSGTGSADMWSDDDKVRLHNLTREYRRHGLDNLKTSGRHVVTAEDFACLTVVVSKLASMMTDEDPMRSKRIKGLWKALKDQGHLQRGWDASRVKVMRDVLSERGLLDWQDNTYTPPEDGDGRAMNWRLGKELTALMSSSVTPDTTTTSSVSTRLLLKGEGEFLLPCRVWKLKPIPRVFWEPAVPDDQYLPYIAA